MKQLTTVEIQYFNTTTNQVRSVQRPITVIGSYTVTRWLQWDIFPGAVSRKVHVFHNEDLKVTVGYCNCLSMMGCMDLFFTDTSSLASMGAKRCCTFT